MKKMLIFISIFALTFSLSACDLLNGQDPSDIVCAEGETLNDEGICVADETPPLVCLEGETEVDGECVADTTELTCPAGQSEVDGECVVDALVCQTDYHEENGACVPDEGTELYRNNVINALITQMDTNPVYLGVVMQDMTFEQGMEIRYEVELEVTKDVDIVETLSVVITDTMVGNMVQREMSLDMNNETLDFSIYYETVEDGVKVYIQPGLFIEALRETDPEAAERLEWVGFDTEWAVFEFDEALDTMIQMDILSDMLSTLFFNEMGAAYFYELQQELEDELFFDFNQYGIDLGLLVDDILAQDIDAATLAIESIDVEGLMLHIDLLYIAPEIFSFLEDWETELIAEGFNYEGLSPLLDTAHWVTDIETNDESVVLLPGVALDGTKGTEAFLNALTDEDKTALVEVFKTIVEADLYYSFRSEMRLEYGVEMNMFNMFVGNEVSFVAEFEQPRFDTLRAMFGTDYYSDYDFITLWDSLTPEEIIWLRGVAQAAGYGWQWDTMDDIDEYLDKTNDVIEFLTLHKTELDAAGYTTDAYITMINTDGLEAWVEDMGSTLFTPLMDEYLYTFIDELEAAYEAGTGLDFLMESIFGNSHMQIILDEIGENPLFDNDALISNMVAIDWNQIALETIDYEALATAIKDGPVTFEAFLAANTATAPNMVLYLEIFAPAVESVQPFMIYVDEMMYAMEGLEAFDTLIDPAFYTDFVLDLEMTNTDDITLLIEAEIDGLGYATLFDEIIDDMNVYLNGFTMIDFPYDEDWVCLDETDESCEVLDMVFVKQVLLGLDPSYITIELDPSNLTWTTIDIDMTELLDGLAEAGYQEYADDMLAEDATWVIANDDDQVTGFNVATISVSMREVSTLVTPDPLVTTSVNDIANDFGRFLVSSEGYSILKDIFDVYDVENNPSAMIELFNTPIYLGDIEGLQINGAFDKTISFFVITGNILAPETLGFELELFWIDGSEVYADALGLNDLFPLFLEGDLVSEVAYDTLVGYPDDETFGLTRVWLLLAMDENNNSMEFNPIEK
jgi:hypothetical protein